MSHGVKVRLIAFVVLSAVGIVYVASNFLGITDKLLGRGLSIEATLPESGGLFTGSEVTYRGVKVGKVSAMDVTPKGLRVRLALEDGTKIPLDTKMYVHNLSAVGEQYLDFEPPDNNGPYAKNGDVLKGDDASMPTSEELLLTQMNSLVTSVDGAELSTVVSEAGTMFRGTANPLQRMVDSGTQFVDEAAANTDSTITLLDTGQHRAADAGGPRAGHPHVRAMAWRTSPARCAPLTRTFARSWREVRLRSARSTRCSRGSSRRCRPSCPTW